MPSKLGEKEPMELIPEPDQKPPSRETLEKAFASAESSLRLEGMTSTPFFFALREHVLAGEITLDQAAVAVKCYHRPGLDPEMRERAEADPVGFCRSIEASRRLALLGGTMPGLPKIPRRRAERAPEPKFDRSSAGIPLFPKNSDDRIITAEMVRKAEEEVAGESVMSDNEYQDLINKARDAKHGAGEAILGECEQTPPFEPLIPNETTIAAMREAREGKLKSVDSVEALMDDLHAEE